MTTMSPEQIRESIEEHLTTDEAYDDGRAQRYMEALQRNPACLQGLLSVPDELASEFYETASIEDNMYVQRGVIAFVQHALTLSVEDVERDGMAITGLYHILQGAMDNAERCIAMMEAARRLADEEGRSHV